MKEKPEELSELELVDKEKKEKIAMYQTPEGKEMLKPSSLAYELNRILATDDEAFSKILKKRCNVVNNDIDETKILKDFALSLNNVANAINKQTQVLVTAYTDADIFLTKALQEAAESMIPVPSPVIGFAVEARTEAYRNITMGMRQLLYYTQINNKIMEILIEPFNSKG